MSWEPNQGGQVPQQPTPPPNPYGAPSFPTPPPPNPYEPPVNPYGPPSSPNPYGYGQPPANPYMPPTYYGGQPGSYPPVAPLPLGQALRELPRQYWRVISRPSAETFVQELGKASWDIVWVQLLGFSALYAIIRFFVELASSALPMSILPGYSGVLSSLAARSSLGYALFVALIGFVLLVGAFFILQGLIYLLARAFNGQGSFLQQCYSSMLIYGPLLAITIVSGILEIIPFVDIIVFLVRLILLIYAIVLLVFATMGSQRLTGGQASAAVLIPVGGLFLLACCVSTLLAATVVSTMHITY
uniref:Yip1 domain-containing protein n=1 Tax=Thermogemmatispora argillosa TaxID=2045280 RepID=A0A455T0E0_9CHLR|nr:hypothetical protein KTA_15170 [Thermogemmatispora argillosa]